MFVGIKDGKIFDICSDLKNKRTADDGIYLSQNELDSIVYKELEFTDFYIGDTWDSQINISLKDAPQRFIIPEKTDFELLQEKIDDLEARLVIQESK